ncbi:hypothetical protein PoB_006350600 [Plakobranchus ocellatus]|uniref:Uncharacterized protein n=1 Tax=Plakobranchus ocellatus TaxID=259542 RepID=A0AAV4CYJ2_9GAST|nr:hypothetical protein PoB_006350600 [Plakobranchus ocellatus]
MERVDKKKRVRLCRMYRENTTPLDDGGSSSFSAIQGQLDRFTTVCPASGLLLLALDTIESTDATVALVLSLRTSNQVCGQDYWTATVCLSPSVICVQSFALNVSSNLQVSQTLIIHLLGGNIL